MILLRLECYRGRPNETRVIMNRHEATTVLLQLSVCLLVRLSPGDKRVLILCMS